MCGQVYEWMKKSCKVSVVATLSLRRIPDNELIKINTNTCMNSERIDEILWLQEKKYHEIIEKNEHNPSVQQTSLAELHRLNITLSNYFEVAPTVVNGINIILPTAPESNKTINTTATEELITV